MLRSEQTFLAAPGGQGKCAATILTESGWHYPVISEQTYRDRAQTAPFITGRGARPMHKSTLVMAKPPWDPVSGFKTTNKQYFGDIGVTNTTRRPEKCRSMHNKHFEIGNRYDTTDDWGSSYTCTFKDRDITTAANRLHRISLVNRIDQTEGAKVKQVLQPDSTQPSYWTQYNRIHNKLGFLLGPGKQRSYPVRKQFNPFTGELVGPVWKEDNKRVSGNRLLRQERCKTENKLILN